MTENYRKTVYCEVEFLKESLSQIDKNSNDEIALQKRRLWNSIVNLLLSPYINLVLDISSDDFISEIENIEKKKIKAARKNESTQLGDFEELLWMLNYKQEESSLHITCNSKDYTPIDTLNNAEHSNMNAIYLTCKDANICEDISRRYGISVLSSKNLDVDKIQLEDAGCAIAKYDRINWQKILQGKCNTSNAMIIVDNYILSDKYDLMNNKSDLDENIHGILDAILPETLSTNVPFHLSVITAKVCNKSEIRFEYLKNLVKDLRPNLNCEISLFVNNGKYKIHDRTIITNSLWIGCGCGFNLFNENQAQKMTVVNVINPYLTDTMQWSKRAYSNLVKAIRAVVNNKNEYIDDSYSDFYLGTGVNRLTE